MIMNKYCYILMFSLILVSCHSGSSNKNSSRVSSGSGYVYKLDKLSPYCTRTVTQIDTLLTYLEEYPRDIAIHNGCLCVAMAKADTCLYIYDKVTGDFLKWVLGECIVPDGLCVLIISPVPAAQFPGCTTKAPSLVCCVSPLVS